MRGGAKAYVYPRPWPVGRASVGAAYGNGQFERLQRSNGAFVSELYLSAGQQLAFLLDMLLFGAIFGYLAVKALRGALHLPPGLLLPPSLLPPPCSIQC